MRTRRWIIIVVVVVVAVLIWATAFRRPKTEAKSKAAGGRDFASMPVPVVAAPVRTGDLPVYLNGLGSVTAYNTVTVRSRVDGQLMQVNFREGQEVKSGQLLAVIDPRPFEVQLHQAEATLAKDQAALTDAEVNLKRFEALFAEKVIAQQQVDTQRSLVGQLQGAIGADRAQIENAKLQLVYCRITAPISGRVGLRLVDPGNMVHASDPNGLLVITQLQPIAVLFTLPEDYVPAVLKHAKKGALQLDAYSRDDLTKIASGKLLTLNNQIDPTTGTTRLKGVFDNTDSVLWPNQFVNVHLLLDVQKNAITIPTAGVQHGSQGTFAYVVKPDKTVEVRPIKVGVTEGAVAAVETGLQPGELVVTDGQDKLQPGSKVEVREGRGGPRNGANGNTVAPGTMNPNTPGNPAATGGPQGRPPQGGPAQSEGAPSPGSQPTGPR
jgi:multidrug efflux system membrane fusion protein